ncbi:MbtH family NRPS accessory protein [Streptomyces sp. NBC_00893]|uniref:MbtH family protein n=1 Tax=Streptomyces sp. NBC_00893 TaxID=2975862 RepID=UPI0022507CB0|nr:MbtH family NRPS accessory protein [Streptomyces sp. NBC_00893]MCX4849422.1 MbtH family NRPS accessory protein [Streptomyces sp. NBC_00893]
MATNPFEDSQGRYVVLANEEGQYSLWPSRIQQPAGWELVKDEGSKQECGEFIEANWTDMRPRSVVAAMGG